MKRNILEYLEKSAELFPDKTAFRDTEDSLTFAETIERSKKIGSYIAEKNSPRQPVAVMLGISVNNLPFFFGAVYAGCFYIPIDSTMSVERVKAMISTLKPCIIITDEKNIDHVRETVSGIEIVLESEIRNHALDVEMIENIRRQSLDIDPLYALFTSGSTGVPKCVLISHRSAIDFFDEFATVFNFTSDDVIGNQAPFDFDVSAKDLFSTIIAGCTMVVVPKQLFSFPQNLISFLNENKITSITWAVSALSIVAGLGALKNDTPKYINKVLFSGEVIPIKHFNQWKKALPDAMFVNLYGPTEITCNCTYYIVDREYDDMETLPIGKPFKNTKILLLNDENKPCGIDETGEVCVSGTCVALGYYNNKTQTEKAFVQNPLNDLYPEIIYRTGDLAKYLPDGNLLFMSRKDFQIKHMGHRIELGEIETAVAAIPGIRMCCCIFDEQNKKIVLFHESDNLSSRDILLNLAQYLPKYMFPNKLIKLDEMPMSKHGKMDRVLLKNNYFENKY